MELLTQLEPELKAMKKHAFCYKEFMRLRKHTDGPPKPCYLLDTLHDTYHVWPFYWLIG